MITESSNPPQLFNGHKRSILRLGGGIIIGETDGQAPCWLTLEGSELCVSIVHPVDLVPAQPAGYEMPTSSTMDLQIPCMYQHHPSQSLPMSIRPPAQRGIIAQILDIMEGRGSGGHGQISDDDAGGYTRPARSPRVVSQCARETSGCTRNAEYSYSVLLRTQHNDIIISTGSERRQSEEQSSVGRGVGGRREMTQGQAPCDIISQQKRGWPLRSALRTPYPER